MSAPTVATLDALDADACGAALAPLFEGAPRFLAHLIDARPFRDADGLFATARRVAHAMPEVEQVELIDAHPRLGAPPATVSELSYREQGYRASDPEDMERRRIGRELDRRNADYEARFGFRYCVWVAGRSRAELLQGFDRALAADRDAELRRALDAVVDIAADRYATLRAQPPVTVAARASAP